MQQITDKIIEARQDELIASTAALVRIPSVKSAPAPNAPFGEEIRRALDYTLALCRRLGLDAHDVDGYAGYAEIPSAQGEQIGVLTHLDVVPAGDGWSFPPFGAQLSQGRMYGRGTSDDKGPLVSSIYALAAIKEAGIPLRKNIRLIFGCDEESGWECMERYDKKIGLPEIGFSPDADYPVINTEKGILHAKMHARFSPDAYTLSVEGGTRPNVVCAKAQAHLEGNIDRLVKLLVAYDCRSNGISYKATARTLDVCAEGVSAHASTPQNGKNAFFALFDFLDTLALGGETGALISELRRCFCGKTDGSGFGLTLHDEISGALTLNLGILRMGAYYTGDPADAGALHGVVDIRYPVCASAEQIMKGLSAASPLLQFEPDHVQPPHHTPEDHYLVQTLLRVYEQYMNRPARCLAIGGGTYARALKTGVAFGVTREGAPELAHNADEYLVLSEQLQDAKLFAAAFCELLQK